MTLVEQLISSQTKGFRPDRLERQLRDYIGVSLKLIWQRQAIFIAATVLAAFYFDPVKAFACYAMVVFTEVLDLILARRITEWQDQDPERAKEFLGLTVLNTVLSAGAISLFVVMIALQQGTGDHFTPLFFLFAAALFAAMNNHQLVPVLILRLIIYGLTFLFIALYDIWLVNPPINSSLWLQFFTIVFVLYFIIDCSLIFLRLYRNGLQQIEELTREHKRTMVAYEAKSQFLSTVSHELRTPLTSIKGSLDLVNSNTLGDVPESMKAVLQIAGKNSRRLADLIDDLLDLQKIEAGEMVFKFHTVNVQQLVRDSVESNKGYAVSLGIGIDKILPDDDVFITGDESRLMQVMANLLSNALKFSHDGGTVEVRVTTTDKRVRISVKDNGVGIPENSKDRVFGQFTQVDASDKRKAGGTGLGMNISREIVERHKGAIDYFSELGHGTTFFVEFERKMNDKD